MQGGGRPVPLPRGLLPFHGPRQEDGGGGDEPPTTPPPPGPAAARSSLPSGRRLAAALPGVRRGGGAGRAGPRAAGGSRWLRSAPCRAAPRSRLASPRRLSAAPAAAKTPRAVLRVKNGAAKLAKPPAAAGEAPGGAPGPGLFMERSQSRLSLSASFEALAIYFPCMNSFDEEDAGTGRGGCRRAGGSRSRVGWRAGGVRGVGRAPKAGGWRAGGRVWGRFPLCVCVHPRVPWECGGAAQARAVWRVWGGEGGVCSLPALALTLPWVWGVRGPPVGFLCGVCVQQGWPGLGC